MQEKDKFCYTQKSVQKILDPSPETPTPVSDQNTAYFQLCIEFQWNSMLLRNRLTFVRRQTFNTQCLSETCGVSWLVNLQSNLLRTQNTCVFMLRSELLHRIKPLMIVLIASIQSSLFKAIHLWFMLTSSTLSFFDSIIQFKSII